MTTTLVLQSPRLRDLAADAALRVISREVAPVQVLAATTDPERTTRLTGLPAIRATRAAVLRALPVADHLVVLGGQPFRSGSRDAEAPLSSSLYALSAAFRAGGKRVALIGVGAEPLSGRAAHRARRLTTGSALTVLDSDASAQALLAAGVPAPVRVGADPAWLDLQEPPAWRGAGIARALVGRGDHPPMTLLASAARELGGLVVQARRGGAAAGADLDACHEVVQVLATQGVRAGVAAPAPTLRAQRDDLAGAGVALCGDVATTMAAAAGGVPLVTWPGDRPSAELASRLGYPVAVDDATPLQAAHDAAGRVQAAVRHEVATAGEATDLLRLLLTEAAEPVPPRPDRVPHRRALRPTGVMR